MCHDRCEQRVISDFNIQQANQLKSFALKVVKNVGNNGSRRRCRSNGPGDCCAAIYLNEKYTNDV